MRYYVTDENGIPLHSQPDEGYTLAEAIQRHAREVVFSGLPEKEADRFFRVVDQNMNIIL